MKSRHLDNLLFIGFVVSQTVIIERKIDDCLAKHFCVSKKRQKDFKQILLYTERMTFNFKKEALVFLMNEYYKDFLKEHKIIPMLEEIAPHRNVFAHLEYESDKTKIIFKKYNNGKLKPKEYTNKSIAKIEKLFYDLEAKLDLLISTISPRI